MNGWEAVQADPGRCCLGRGQVSTGAGTLNQRSEPIYQPQYVVGAWVDGAELLIWDVTPAVEPPGEWLLCQPASGPVTPVCWSHSSGVVRVIEG